MNHKQRCRAKRAAEKAAWTPEQLSQHEGEMNIRREKLREDVRRWWHANPLTVERFVIAYAGGHKTLNDGTSPNVPTDAWFRSLNITEAIRSLCSIAKEDQLSMFQAWKADHWTARADRLVKEILEAEIDMNPQFLPF